MKLKIIQFSQNCNMKKIKYLLLVAFLVLIPGTTKAHCPLCTIGAGAASGVAVWLGISYMSVGVMIGAFALATGLWMSRLIKKKFIRHQNIIIAIVSYVTTVWPLRLMLKSYGALYLPWWGQYGTTFVIDKYLIGTAIGAIIMILSPYLSKQISKHRDNKNWPYQGVSITFGLLIITSIIIELIIWKMKS